MKIGGTTLLFLYELIIKLKTILHKLAYTIFCISVLVAGTEKDALEYYFLGEYELLNQNLDKAEKYFLKATLIDSTSSTIYSSLSELNLLKGDYLKAMTFAEREYKLNPNSPEIGLQLYELYLLNQKLDLAESHIEKMIVEMSDDIDIRLKLAELQFHKQKWEELINNYFEIYLLSSQDTKQKYFDFMFEIGIRTQQYDPLLLAIEKILDINGNQVEILKQYSNLLYSIGNYEKTAISLEKLLSLEPDNIDINLLLTQVYLLLVEPSLAEGVISRLYEIDKENLSVLRTALIVYSLNENNDKLVEVSKKMIMLYPELPDGYESLGLSYSRQEDDSLAFDILSQGNMKFPENANFPYWIASIHNLNNKFDQAEDYFLKALSISPEDKQIRLSLASMYENSNEFTNSDSLYQLLISEDENDASLLNNYAYNLCVREKVTQTKLNYALDLATKADELESDNSAYLDTVGWIYYKLKNYSLAHNYISKSIELDDKSSVILEHAGDIYIKLGKLEEAEYYYQKALKLAPDNSILNVKIQRLNNEDK